MQLGLTIPLQRFLKVHQPPYGTLCDLFYCWDLHRIILQSKETLVAVNANNRFAIVMCGMDSSAWKDYNALHGWVKTGHVIGGLYTTGD